MRSVIEEKGSKCNLKNENLAEIECTNIKIETQFTSNTLILYGASVPIFSSKENTVDIALNIVNECCKLNFEQYEIINDHRWGKPGGTPESSLESH